jgi:hypothetical protein
MFPSALIVSVLIVSSRIRNGAATESVPRWA